MTIIFHRDNDKLTGITYEPPTADSGINIPGTLNALADSIIAIADTADSVPDLYDTVFDNPHIRQVAASALRLSTDTRFKHLPEHTQQVIADHCAGCALDIAARVIIRLRQAS